VDVKNLAKAPSRKVFCIEYDLNKKGFSHTITSLAKALLAFTYFSIQLKLEAIQKNLKNFARL